MRLRTSICAILAAGFVLATGDAVWARQQPARPPKKQPQHQPARRDPAPPPETPIEQPVPAPADPGKVDPKGQKVDLRPKFKQGEQLRLRMEMDNTSKVSIPAVDDKPREQVSKQEMMLLLKVKEVTEAGATLELSFQSVKMTQVSGKEKEEFDSARPASQDKDNPLAAPLRALVGTVFTVNIDKDGTISNIGGGAGLGALGGGGLGGLGNSLGLGGQGGAAGSGGAAGTGFQDALGSIFSVKKGSGLASVGEKWSTTDVLDTGLMGRFRMITDNTLKSLRNNEATVNTTGRMEPDTQAGGGASMFQIKDSFYTGSFVWDTKAGMVKRMEVDQKIVIDTNAGGAAMSMSSTGKTRVTRVD